MPNDAPDNQDNPSGEGRLSADGKLRIFGFSKTLTEALDPPRVPDNKPIKVELKPGRYSWCSCGHSRNQPFCDNAHRAAPTNRKSYKFEALEQTTQYLCNCKLTKDPPFCDDACEKLENDLH